MTIRTLYKKIHDGTVTFCLNRPDGEYTTRYRLIASDGMLLTNGDIEAACIDIEKEDLENWYEIPAPAEPEEVDYV